MYLSIENLCNKSFNELQLYINNLLSKNLISKLEILEYFSTSNTFKFFYKQYTDISMYIPLSHYMDINYFYNMLFDYIQPLKFYNKNTKRILYYLQTINLNIYNNDYLLLLVDIDYIPRSTKILKYIFYLLFYKDNPHIIIDDLLHAIRYRNKKWIYHNLYKIDPYNPSFIYNLKNSIIYSNYKRFIILVNKGAYIHYGKDKCFRWCIINIYKGYKINKSLKILEYLLDRNIGIERVQNEYDILLNIETNEYKYKHRVLQALSKYIKI
jgi:hypothetical protein